VLELGLGFSSEVHSKTKCVMCKVSPPKAVSLYCHETPTLYKQGLWALSESHAKVQSSII
jgi:hypothetical protein